MKGVLHVQHDYFSAFIQSTPCFLELSLPRVKNIFASRTQILRPKHMFPSLAITRSITRNNVSANVFPSLAKPLMKALKFKVGVFQERMCT